MTVGEGGNDGEGAGMTGRGGSVGTRQRRLRVMSIFAKYGHSYYALFM